MLLKCTSCKRDKVEKLFSKKSNDIYYKSCDICRSKNKEKRINLRLSIMRCKEKKKEIIKNNILSFD